MLSTLYSVCCANSGYSSSDFWRAGFSFSGEVRAPFGPVIEALAKSKAPVTSVDAPSSWNIESGPPDSGPGKDFNPAALVSLTAPKPLVKWFKGKHFLGGR